MVTPQQHVGVEGLPGRPAVLTQGDVPHDAADSGNPVSQGLNAQEDFSSITDVAVDDRVRATGTRKGAPFVAHGARTTMDGQTANYIFSIAEDDVEAFLGTVSLGRAPDGSTDPLRSAGDSGPGLGATNVAPIGGDLQLRASAIAGEANGQSTALDDLGWVKSFSARLDVTAAPSGGSPTLDVFIQTQNASGDWQDIVGFTRATGVTAENVAWGGGDSNSGSGIGAEGSAVTFDRFFPDQDVALADATIRVMPLGDSMRVKWVFAAGGSTGDFTFAVDSSFHS